MSSVKSFWRGTSWSERGAVSAVLLGGYVLLSQSLIHLFPFSVFDMYSEDIRSGSRIVARGADGEVTEVDHYRDWDCPEALDVHDACSRSGAYYIPYKDAEAVSYVQAHRGHDPAAAAVVLVRRIWWLSDRDAKARIEDCPIAECRAVPR
jgi:hypothetical protein